MLSRLSGFPFVPFKNKLKECTMKRIILIFLLLAPSLIVVAQNQDVFYDIGNFWGVAKTFIEHDLNPINGKVTDSDGKLRPYKNDPNIWGLSILMEWNQTGKWAFNMSIKSHFIDDFIYMLGRIKNNEDTDPESPWFYSFLELNCGLNVFYNQTTRIAAGLSSNIFHLEFWDNKGEFNDQRGTYINLGPYFNGDYLLSDDIMLKLGFSFTVPVSAGTEVNGAKKPSFINFTPGIMMKSGLYFGIDYTLISGLEDSAKTGTKLSGSRFELKLGLFTNIL